MHDRYDDEDEKERIGRIFFDERESPRDQYREGYPNATEPEIKMLLAAEKKNGGTPPSSLDHAKIILSDNVWIFKPRRDSPIGRKRATCEYRPTRPDHWLAARAVHEEHRAREAAAAYREHMAKLLGPFRAKMLALARTLQMIGRWRGYVWSQCQWGFAGFA